MMNEIFEIGKQRHIFCYTDVMKHLPLKEEASKWNRYDKF